MSGSNATSPKRQLTRGPNTRVQTTKIDQSHGLLNERLGSRLLPTHEPGYLGSTSYSAFIIEDQAQDDLENLTTTSISDDAGRPRLTALEIGSRRMAESIAVLALLRDFPALQCLAGKWSLFHRYMSMIDFFVEDCTKSLGSDLVDNNSLVSEASMKASAIRLFQNTCKRVSIPKTARMVDFIKFYTGTALRWEALAIFFIACGLCCSSLRSRDDSVFDALGKRPEEKQALMERLLEASSACISFCEDAGELSDLGLWIHLENTFFTSHVLGDNHYLVWWRCHNASTHIIAQGLHTESSTTIQQQPFWLVELRRRALACAFSSDKLLATFNGRPPMLTQRYCSLHIPLDLELSELCLEGEALQKALTNIDDNGWNRKYSKKAAYLRCFVLSSQLREEVLELSLGTSGDIHLLDKAMDIIRRNKALLDSLPAAISYRSDMWNDSKPSRAFMAGQGFLDVLYNEFMLRRLIYRRLAENRSELLSLSHTILTTILEISSIRFCHIANADYIPWILVLYGLPAAGVLSLELLEVKQGNSMLPIDLSKTQVLQDLCVFISNLKVMHGPTDGNYKLSHQAYKSLQRILNKIFSDYISPISHDNFLPSPDQTAELTDLSSGFFGYEVPRFDIDFWIDLPESLQSS